MRTVINGGYPPSLLKYFCRSLSAVMLTVILWVPRGRGSALLTSSFGELRWMDMIMRHSLYHETIVNTNISVVHAPKALSYARKILH